MREILFRGKQVGNGEWVEGSLLTDDSLVDPKKWTYDIIGKNERRATERYFVITETIGQYTGKDDDNGEKLFEGDIVKGLFRHGDSILSVVAFKAGAFGLEWMQGKVKMFSAFTSICNIGYEKIGNIHDNPELLKEGADNG